MRRQFRTGIQAGGGGMRGKIMSNVIEFFRMVLSYLMVFAVIAAVSGIGGFIGVKVWKPKAKSEQVKE